MVTIGVDQSLSNSDLYEHVFLENINKLCKNSGKFNNNQQYKVIIKSSMVSTTEWFTDNSPMIPTHSEPTKKPSSIKLPRKFLEVLDVKHKTNVWRFYVAKANIKVIRTGNVLQSNIAKRHGHTKINQKVKEDL